RHLLEQYLTARTAGERKKLLEKFPERDLPSIDQMAQLVSLSPPIRPDEKMPVGISQQKAQGATYLLQLPNEYHHFRPTPVLLVLHNSGEEAKAMMERWAERAKEEGFILAAPVWSQGINAAGYGYTQAEHDIVLDTLRDLQRRFNVDADRVFLFGFGD